MAVRRFRDVTEPLCQPAVTLLGAGTPSGPVSELAVTVTRLHVTWLGLGRLPTTDSTMLRHAGHTPTPFLHTASAVGAACTPSAPHLNFAIKGARKIVARSVHGQRRAGSAPIRRLDAHAAIEQLHATGTCHGALTGHPIAYLAVRYQRREVAHLEDLLADFFCATDLCMKLFNVSLALLHRLLVLSCDLHQLRALEA